MHEYTVIVTFVRSTSATYVKVITFLMDMINIKKFFSKNEDQPLFIRNVEDIHTKSEFQCTDCDDTIVCSSCMASETHVRHRFVELAGDYKLIKEIIGKEKEEFLNFIYPYYEEVAIDLENQTANLDKEYEKLTTEIPKQGDLWHSEIDIIINKMKVEIGEIKVKHKDILQKHMNNIKQTQSLIKRTIIALEEFEKSNEVYSIIKYSSKIREFRKVLPKIKVSLPTFIPTQIDGTKLYSLFGHITPLSTVTEKNVLSLNQPVKELLDEPQLIATIQTGFKKTTQCSLSK